MSPGTSLKQSTPHQKLIILCWQYRMADKMKGSKSITENAAHPHGTADVSLCFEVHQPRRTVKHLRYDPIYERLKDEELYGIYFDDKLNEEIFHKVASKCYYPATRIILGEIERYRDSDRPFKVAYSISGIFIEQCEAYEPELLELFREIGRTGCAEFMCQTYYHSLASLYEDKTEFHEHVRMHDKMVRTKLNYEPTFFENTELLFNNEVAKLVEDMGYEGMFTEGVDRVLEWRSPNYVYRPAGCEYLKVLMRNYQLTDDIGFRFSAPDWEEYPLTAEKYGAWLAAAASGGQCVNIFMDYETLGEHHWVETGIHEFLRFLPGEVLKYRRLKFSTPTEIVRRHQPAGEGNVGVFDTISWADLERNTSCWTGNDMQRHCYWLLKDLEKYVKMTGSKDLLKIWRLLQTSDHLHHMFTGGEGPGEVHNYFSPFDTPLRAFISYYAVLTDFERRVKGCKK